MNISNINHISVVINFIYSDNLQLYLKDRNNIFDRC
jgi:hypothetical protein